MADNDDVHKPLTSKDEFQAALATKDKYVLIFAYQGADIPPGAKEYAKKFASTTDAYKVNVDDFPTAKENLKLTELPAVLVFKDGKEIKRVENMNAEKAKEIAEVLA